MTSYDLLDFYEKVLNKIEELNVYTKELSNLINNVNKERDILLNVAYTNNVERDASSNIKINNQKNTIINLVRKFSMDFDVLDNHSKLIQIREELNNIMSNFPVLLEGEKCKITDLLDNYSRVTSMIIEYLKTRGDNIIVELLNNALITVNKYDKFVESYKSIKNFILKTENKLDGKEDEEILQLQFYDEHIDPEYFIKNIQSICDSYEIICQVFNISLNDNELKVLKIESGSLFLKIIGNASVIAAFGFFMKELTKLIFNKFTFEGKIMRHRQLLDLIKENVEVTEKYKELGMNIEFDEDIVKYHYQLIKSMSTLIGQTTKVKINEEELVLEDHLKQKYLTESKVLLIEESTTKKDLEKYDKKENK
ncbi:hypothetical protein C3B64_17950 [Clostridium botulinum]|uniref:Uncharacterized protein n=1 Tax=Clostridium botulinum TaxID=1491 RepID=A0AAU8Z0R1_CLOBO|nr:hypothetical protein [Clostridium sporogenes]AVP66022.1 hypothetical protein C3B64_17950 [Clostridium botulinum]